MDYLIALVPSIFAGLVLWFILRWISRADRTERETQRQLQDDAAQWYEKVKQSDGTKNPFAEDKDKPGHQKQENKK